MAFQFAGAAAGANDALQEMLTRKRTIYLQQQAEAERQAQGARADRELQLQERAAGDLRAQRQQAATDKQQNEASLDQLANDQSFSQPVRQLIQLRRRGVTGINSVADLIPKEPAKPDYTTPEKVTGPDGKPVLRVFRKDAPELQDGSVHPYVEPKTPKDTSVSDASRADRSYQAAKGELDKLAAPVADRMDRLGRLNDSLNQRTPQADAVIAPEMMVVMAGGQGSGVRITQPELDSILGGRSNVESIKAALNKWRGPGDALTITDAQRAQMRALVATVQKKAQAKLDVVRQAQHSLIDATDVQAHRRAVEAAHAAFDKIDAGGGQEQAPAGGAGGSLTWDPVAKKWVQ